jgi:hypothetical protein
MHFAPARLDGSFHTHASKHAAWGFQRGERVNLVCGVRAHIGLLPQILDSFERKGAHIFSALHPLGNLCPIKTREGWRGKVLMVTGVEKLKMFNFWTSKL